MHGKTITYDRSNLMGFSLWEKPKTTKTKPRYNTNHENRNEKRALAHMRGNLSKTLVNSNNNETF